MAGVEGEEDEHRAVFAELIAKYLPCRATHTVLEFEADPFLAELAHGSLFQHR